MKKVTILILSTMVKTLFGYHVWLRILAMHEPKSVRPDKINSLCYEKSPWHRSPICLGIMINGCTVELLEEINKHQIQLTSNSLFDILKYICCLSYWLNSITFTLLDGCNHRFRSLYNKIIYFNPKSHCFRP